MKVLSMLSLVLGLSVGVQAPLVFAQAPKKEVSKADKAKAKKAVTAAQKALKAGDYEKALASYKDAYALSPEAEYLAAIGDCYVSLTRYSEALAAYDSYLKEAGYNTPLRAEVEKKVPETKAALAKANKTNAALAYSSKDYAKALSLYQASYDAAPDPVLFYNIGLSHMQLKNAKDGIAALESYLKSAPATDANRADAEVQLTAMQEMSAEASFAAGQYDESLATYRMLYAKDAQPKRLVEIGRVYQKMGKTDDANTAFRNFLSKADPNDPLRPEIEAQLPKTAAVTPKEKPNKRDKDKPKDPGAPSDEGGGKGFSKFMLVTAGVTGAAGAAAGILAFTSTQKLNELSSVSDASDLNEEEIAANQLRRQRFAPACDALLGVAVVTGVVGVIGLLSGDKKSEAKTKTTLLVSPNGATLTVRY